MAGPISEHDWVVHSLNIHGTFFEKWCAHVVGNSPGWTVRSTHYPVRFPPNDAGRESAIDVLAYRRRRNTLITAVIECKKNNPEFVRWAFFRRGDVWAPAVHGVGKLHDKWSVVKILTDYWEFGADEAREVRGSYSDHRENKTKTKTSNASIADAADQVAIGTQAIAWEERSRAETVDAKFPYERRDWNTQVVLPIIVTTALLSRIDFEASEVSPATGEIPFDRVKLVDVPYIVYQHALPRHLHSLESRVELYPTDEAIEHEVRLHVAVVNSGHLSEFLQSPLIDRLTK